MWEAMPQQQAQVYDTNGWDPEISQRGGGGLSRYETTDPMNTVIGADYFSNNEVRSVIQKQRQTATGGINVLVRASDDTQIIELRMDNTTGAVSTAPAATRIT